MLLSCFSKIVFLSFLCIGSFSHARVIHKHRGPNIPPIEVLKMVRASYQKSYPEFAEKLANESNQTIFNSYKQKLSRTIEDQMGLCFLGDMKKEVEALSKATSYFREIHGVYLEHESQGQSPTGLSIQISNKTTTIFVSVPHCHG